MALSVGHSPSFQPIAKQALRFASSPSKSEKELIDLAKTMAGDYLKSKEYVQATQAFIDLAKEDGFHPKFQAAKALITQGDPLPFEALDPVKATQVFDQIIGDGDDQDAMNIAQTFADRAACSWNEKIAEKIGVNVVKTMAKKFLNIAFDKALQVGNFENMSRIGYELTLSLKDEDSARTVYARALDAASKAKYVECKVLAGIYLSQAQLLQHQLKAEKDGLSPQDAGDVGTQRAMLEKTRTIFNFIQNAANLGHEHAVNQMEAWRKTFIDQLMGLSITSGGPMAQMVQDKEPGIDPRRGWL